MSFSIIGKKFTIAEFDAYCDSLPRQSWVKKIVLHNTAIPSLAARPGGILTTQHIKNLKHYYEVIQKWSGGPHLFVDATGIWVFNPLTESGVHSPSYNGNAWGIEMLGNFQTESFTSGLGLAVATNAQHAMASLAQLQGWTSVSDKMILHKEDPNTTHRTCPGKNVSKADFIAKVNDILKPIENKPDIEVVAGGVKINGAYLDDENLTYVPLRTFCDALGLKITYVSSKNQIIVTK